MKEEISFEKAFERLEQILTKMNEEKVSLDTSLKLFEEANALIKNCNEKLSFAEQKIQILIKERSNLKTENDKPVLEEFRCEK